MAQMVFLFICLSCGWCLGGKYLFVCIFSYISNPFASLGLQTDAIPLHFLLGFSEAIQENMAGKEVLVSLISDSEI